MEGKRHYGLDLLCVVCMLMIVSSHYLVHGGVLATVPVFSFNDVASRLFQALFSVMVNCFVMISGYFLSASPFRMKKWLSVYAQALFYSVILYLAFCLADPGIFSFKELAQSLLVFTQQRYWFVTCYLLMMFLSPLLNCALKAMDQKTHLRCCIGAFLLYSCLTNLIYFKDFSGVNGGHSSIWFCVLYLIAAYIRKYNTPGRTQKRKALPLYFLCCLFAALSQLFLRWLTLRLLGKAYFTSIFAFYSAVPVAIGSICLFLFFLNIDIDRAGLIRLISFFSPLTFGVYLIHDHTQIRQWLWLSVIKPYTYADSSWLFYTGFAVRRQYF